MMKQTAPQQSVALIDRLLPHYVKDQDGTAAVIGCDPGPEYSAFARVSCKDGKLCCDWAGYISNDVILNGSPEDFLNLFPAPAPMFIYEKTANHGRVVGALVFNTCAASGMIRYLARSSGLATKTIAAISPSMWRYLTVGFGSAKDTETRGALEDVLMVANVKEVITAENKRAKKVLGLTKPCTSHLRDAVGVAVAALMGMVRVGPEGALAVADVIWEAEDGQNN